MSYQLWLGDCLSEMNKIPDESVDLIFTDLPYGTTNCSWDSLIDLDLLWNQYKRVRKDNTAIVLFAQTPFDKVLGVSNISELRYEWIWEKTQATGHLNSKKMPMKAHENVLVFYKNLPTYNPQKTNGHVRKVSLSKHKENTESNQSDIYHKSDRFSDYDSTERFPRSVQIFSSDKQKSALHSTQKPLALCEYFIKTYSNIGDTVLDSCMGSGTTIDACERLGRNSIGIEKYKPIFDIAVNRMGAISV